MASSKYIFPVIFILLITFTIPALAQTNIATGKYPKGKLFLYDGRIVEGKKMLMSGDTISLSVYGITQTFYIDEIQQIMAKKGHASLFSCGCGVGCLGIAGLAYAISGGEYKNEDGFTQKMRLSEYILGTAIWSALFAGGGYLVGYIFDDWSVVYYQPHKYGMRHDTSSFSNHDEFKSIPLLVLEGNF